MQIDFGCQFVSRIDGQRIGPCVRDRQIFHSADVPRQYGSHVGPTSRRPSPSDRSGPTREVTLRLYIMPALLITYAAIDERGASQRPVEKGRNSIVPIVVVEFWRLVGIFRFPCLELKANMVPTRREVCNPKSSGECIGIVSIGLLGCVSPRRIVKTDLNLEIRSKAVTRIEKQIGISNYIAHSADGRIRIVLQRLR